ncbi:unnamed protein product [Cuscuta europaea]|uniref:SHSP domain-containing protein n=1 Tax=Cuscuta europaea TaxID=41803 RepID=A0A9P0Z418_CUSEU|nr:unnamed protein product [Cuscuta europaea]
MAGTVINLRNAAAAASTGFTKFLRHKIHSTPITPSITNRLFSSSTTGADPPSGDPYSKIYFRGAPQRFKLENPFQIDGPGNVIEVDEAKEGTVVRVAMPGVAADGFKVWAEKDTVFFAGKGEIEMEGEESGRNYGGSLEFDPELHMAQGVKAEMKNGILKMLVPNAGGQQNNPSSH